MKKPWEQVDCLNDEFGAKVKAMKIKDIRTAIIASSLSPIGDQGELKKRLADFLRQKAGNAISKNDTSSNKVESNGGSGMDASTKALLEAIVTNEGNNAFILSLSGKVVSTQSSKGDLRKAYLLLSTKVHPDKHGGSKEAVQAFQMVLSAYGNLVNPPEDDDDEKPKAKRQKTERFTRSNAGCYQTKLACPQCKLFWGDASSGVEDAAYNFMMMGIKRYICGRCFCKFGCMTALHYCPHCKKQFEYDVDDYHNKIVCSNEKCQKVFGFWMYKVSERREKEIRLEVKKEFEEERKRLAQKKRREARAGRRVDVSDDVSGDLLIQEQLMIIGLRDSCPRCGWEISRGEGTAEAQEHLNNCNDKAAIKKYQKLVAKQKEEEKRKKNTEEMQHDVMALKRWEMNGKQVGQLWMLSEMNIKKQCEMFGLSCEGAKHEMIARLSEHLRKKQNLLITDGRTHKQLEASYDTCGIQDADPEDLPENIEALDEEELQSLCASYNVKFNPKKDRKSKLLSTFEASRYKGQETLLICGKKGESSDEDDSILDKSDAEYIPEEVN